MFVVNIEDSKKVSNLQDLIKEKNPSSLGNVDTKDLDLWAAEFEVDVLTTELADKTVNEGQKLSPMKKLSAIFDNVPNDGFLHVIARAPGNPHTLLNLIVTEFDLVLLFLLSSCTVALLMCQRYVAP